MNYYTSDLHLGHKNVIKFDNRPYSDVYEMDDCLIKNWNNKVTDNDDVYIVGDFAFKSGKSSDWYLKQLKGRKHLIIGNHDRVTLNNDKAMKYFVDVDKMKHVSDEYEGRTHQVCLCHYPMIEWYKSFRGTWLFYGHIHNRKAESFEIMKNIERA